MEVKVIINVKDVNDNELFFIDLEDLFDDLMEYKEEVGICEGDEVI